MISLMVRQRDVDFGQVLSSELAAYPPSMFHSDGSMRLATGKAQGCRSSKSQGYSYPLCKNVRVSYLLCNFQRVFIPPAIIMEGISHHLKKIEKNYGSVKT